jgi:hypothetical protein
MLPMFILHETTDPSSASSRPSDVGRCGRKARYHQQRPADGVQAAQRRIKDLARLDGTNQLQKVIGDVRFQDGIEVLEVPATMPPDRLVAQNSARCGMRKSGRFASDGLGDQAGTVSLACIVS